MTPLITLLHACLGTLRSLSFPVTPGQIALKRRVMYQIPRSALTSVCLILLSGCSDSELSDSSLSMDQSDESTGERAGTDMSPSLNDNDIEPGAGSSQDDVGVPPEMIKPCDHLATPDTEDAFANDDETSIRGICLDELGSYGEDTEAEIQEALAADDITQCGIADELSATLSERDVVVRCTDEDEDCYYVCEGWILPNHLQDPDDRRSFVVGTSSTGDQERCTFDESVPISCCRGLNAAGLYEDSSALRDDEPLLCRISLFTEVAGSAEIKLVRACQGGGVMWVVEQERKLSLRMLDLEQAERRPDPTSSEVFELTSAVSQVSALECIQNNGAFTAIFTDQDQHAYVVFESILADYEQKNIYSSRDRIMISEQGVDVPITLADVDWSVDQISVNEAGFFSWELSLTLPESDYSITYSDFLTNDVPSMLPGDVITRAVAEDDNGRRIASLKESGLSLTLLDDDMSLTNFTFDASGFDRIVSGDQLLALTTTAPSRIARFLFWGVDSFWGDLNSHLRIPLTLNAAELGVEALSVENVSRGGALLKLISDDVGAATWVHYSFIRDRVQSLDWGSFIDDPSRVMNSMDLKTPELSNNRIFWIERRLSNGPTSDTDNTSSVTMFMMRLSR